MEKFNFHVTTEVCDEKPLSIEGIVVGDTFYTVIGKSKILSEVVDFVKSYSMTTGEVLSIKVIAKVYGFGNQNTWENTFEDVLKSRKKYF